MSPAQRKAIDAELTKRLTTRGFRFTPQREHVYTVLLQYHDHPTAEEVFIRVKSGMPEISMATVYNCLDALVQCGVVRQVTLDRRATRFCSNMLEHSHFYCDGCGGVYDMPAPKWPTLTLPKGFTSDRVDVAVHGRCSVCNNVNGKTRD
jgi:Fur family peroxide stress response transcriptional regulator